jgi:hypothetical protein
MKPPAPVMSDVEAVEKLKPRKLRWALKKTGLIKRPISGDRMLGKG